MNGKKERLQRCQDIYIKHIFVTKIKQYRLILPINRNEFLMAIDPSWLS